MIVLAEKIEKEIRHFELCKEFLLCDFEKGLIVWIKSPSNRAKIGDMANSYDGKYFKFKLKGRNSLVHRFIFYCYHGILFEEIDHKNGIKYDNRIINLRGGTKSQNLQNQTKPQCSNLSGFLGVSFQNTSQKYLAQIQTNGKKKFIGLFDCPKEAHEAYLTSKRELHDFCTI